MLPSLGFFKTILCPYYENSGECCRPFCHFKHAKKDDTQEQFKVPVYKPTPITPKLMTLEISAPTTKKRKLEYSPTNPGFDAHQPKIEDANIPVYVPSNSLKTNSEIAEITELYVDDHKCDSETLTVEASSDIVASKENSILDNADESVKCILPIQTESESQLLLKPDNSIKSTVDKDSPVDLLPLKQLKASSSSHTKQHKSSKESSSASLSASSSSSLKKRHSSNEKSRSSSDSRKKSDEDNKSSSSSSKKRSSSSSTSSSSHRHKSSSSSSSSNKDSYKNSSSSKEKSSRSSSSSSSSKSKSKEKSKDEKNDKESQKLKTKSTKSTKSLIQNVDNNKELFSLPLSDDDDDLVLKQCKRIFDELHSEAKDTTKEINVTETVKVEDPPEYGDWDNKKKRVAHDNGLNINQPTIPIPKKVNHVQNAMLAIVKRQEIIRQKEKEEAEAAAKEVQAAELKLKEASEALRIAKEKNVMKLTPLIPRSYLTPPKPVRSIAPVANLLALERAKKKVEELQAARIKGLTPCKTAPRAEGRVAHKTSSATVESVKLAPPVLEPNATKISLNIRSQYYNIMVKHCLTIYPNCEDAWNRAQTEELVVFKKCNTPVIYKSSSLLAINKLRKESIDAGNLCTEKNKTVSHEVILAGKLASNTSWSVNKKIRSTCTNPLEAFDRLPDLQAYELINDLVLTEEQLVSNGYPRESNIPGEAVVHFCRPNRRPNDNPDERYCSRCSKVFNLSLYEEEAVDQCNFHPKSTGYRRGFADNLHRCCQQPASAAGCTYANYHVTDYIDSKTLSGFVSTIPKGDDYIPTKKDIFALDCEMCYTTHGIELTRVTVVNINSKTVYDALVQPDNKIVDYNTVYSGITQAMLEKEKRSLHDVQAVLLSMFHSKTILIGHSLESDMKALKIIHSHYVDTSVLYPHKMGPPMKRALKTLCIENLKRIIQENEHGHDSAEDAEVCIQLVKVYLKNKIS